MSSRIILVRHGRSAHVHTGWVDAAGLRNWMAAYDAAGIAPGECPSAELQLLAQRAGALLCSDMPRALASAEMLAQGRSFTVSPLLREAALRVPPGIACRLPLIGWALAISVHWVLSKLRGEGPPKEEYHRAREAAEWIEHFAAAGDDVLAVTHGTFRGLVAGALMERGWRCTTRWRRYHNWSAWILARENTPAVLRKP